MTITEFLEARIGEDEATAREIAACESHDPEGQGYEGTVMEAVGHKRHGVITVDPARVLAECAAKRAVVKLHRPGVETVEWFDDTTGLGTAPVCPSCRPKDPTDWNPPMGMAGVRPDGFVPSYTLAPCPTLRTLAAVYATHPDYRQEWTI